VFVAKSIPPGDTRIKAPRIMAELQEEQQTYNDHLQELLKDENKFVLIHQGEIVGIFEKYEEALTQGYEKFGVNPFLVKKIEAVEAAHFISCEFA
jgi:hypothetical protein